MSGVSEQQWPNAGADRLELAGSRVRLCAGRSPAALAANDGVTMLRVPALLMALLFWGCTPFHRIEVPEDGTDGPRTDSGECRGISEFWRANGFKSFREPFVFGSAPHAGSTVRATATWVRDYPGWLFPSSGQVWGTEVSDDDKCVVHIYSNRRDGEAADIAENFRRFVISYHPTATVQIETSHFLDLR
jgi:hypothetical protein